MSHAFLCSSYFLFLSDVVYCPRLTCGAAVIREESGQVAMCSVCGFAFCVACRKTYHGDGSCFPDISEEVTDTPEFGSEELPLSAGTLAFVFRNCQVKKKASIMTSVRKKAKHLLCTILCAVLLDRGADGSVGGLH